MVVFDQALAENWRDVELEEQFSAGAAPDSW